MCGAGKTLYHELLTTTKAPAAVAAGVRRLPSGRLDELQVLVALAQDGFAVSAEPTVQHGGVDGAEVGGEFQVAGVQV